MQGFIAITCLLKKTFIIWFIQQILIEHQLCALSPEFQTYKIERATCLI